jgi:hypothetical protein
MRKMKIVVAAIAAFGVVAAPSGASYLSTKSALEVAKSARSRVAHDQMFNGGWTDWATKPLVARRVNSRTWLMYARTSRSTAQGSPTTTRSTASR